MMAGKYKAYPSYRATDVKWLGDIPTGWKICAIKHVSTLNPAKSKLRYQQGDECSFVPMEKLKTDSLALDEIRPIADVYDGYTYFVDDDILMAKVTPCFENKNIAIAKDMVNGVGFGSSEIYVLRSNQKTKNRYLFYRLQEDGFMEVATSSMTGAGGLKRVPSDVLNNFLVALPVHEEQTQIANFLDHETAKIDTLIDKQQQLIKLLKEKRQAVISHAVTKGLNPDALMKDSGVEWLGEVPEGWRVVPLKYLVSELDGIQMGPFGGMLLGLGENETGYKVFGQENTISGDFTKGLRWISKARFEDLSNYHLKVGDIVLTRKGSLGNARLVSELAVMGIIDSDTIRIRINSRKLQPKLMSFLMHNALYVSEQIARNRRGAILPGLNTETISNILLLVPQPLDQRELFEYLQVQNHKFDTAVEKCISAIALLEERRTALISAAVTGKIDVRKWNSEQAESDMGSRAKVCDSISNSSNMM
jgi:type I restriction enzyme S subunit